MYEETPSLCGSSCKYFRRPINEEEARNDPKLKSQTDYAVEWKKVKGDIDTKLEPYIDGFISWLNRKEDRLSAYKKTENTRV